MLHAAWARTRSSPTLMPSAPMNRSPLAHIGEMRNSRPTRSEPAASTALSASIVNAIQAQDSSVVSGTREVTPAGSRTTPHNRYRPAP
jgi:hypothetical protein